MRKLCICFFLFLMLLCCGISKAEMKNQTLSLPNHEDEIISVVAIEDTLYLSGRNGLYCINKDEASPVCIDGITGIGDGDLNRGYPVNAIEYLFSMQGRLYGLSTAYGIVYEIIIENGVGRTEELIRLDWNGMVGQTDNYAYALTWESMYYLNDHLYILGYDLNDDFDYLHPMLRVFNLKNGEQRKTEVPNAQHILGQKNDELVLMMYDREAEINAWEEEQFCPAIYLWDPGTEKMIYLFDMNTRDAYGILYHEDTNAVYYIDNGKLYKTIFTGSAAYPFLAHNMGWDYDVSKVTIPYFMTSGTGKTDDADVPDITKDFAGVCPLEAVITNYNGISDDVEKVRARATGAEHEDMLVRSDGYMTAWMLYQLCGDEEAAKVFVGDDAEIQHNSNWQDIEKND